MPSCCDFGLLHSKTNGGGVFLGGGELGDEKEVVHM